MSKLAQGIAAGIGPILRERLLEQQHRLGPVVEAIDAETAEENFALDEDEPEASAALGEAEHADGDAAAQTAPDGKRSPPVVFPSGVLMTPLSPAQAQAQAKPLSRRQRRRVRLQERQARGPRSINGKTVAFVIAREQAERINEEAEAGRCSKSAIVRGLLDLAWTMEGHPIVRRQVLSAAAEETAQDEA